MVIICYMIEKMIDEIKNIMKDEINYEINN